MKLRGLVALVIGLGVLVCGIGEARADDPAAARLAEKKAAFAAVHGARQIAPLLGALVAPGGDHAMEDELFDGGASLVSFLEAAAEHAEDPLVQARASFELARLYERRGRHAEAGKRRDAIGLVGEHGLMVGPFASDDGAELRDGVTLAPEPAILTNELTLDKTWPQGTDRGGVARVRALPTVTGSDGEGRRLAGGVIPLGAFVRPETRVVVYLVFAVSSDRARDVALRVGSDGAVTAWHNGHRIGAHTGDRPLALDADGFGASLVPGLNRFVVRVAVSDRQPELLLRITEPNGAVIHDLREGDPRAAVKAIAHERAVAVRTLRSALGSLRGDAALDRDEYVFRDGIDGPADKGCGDGWGRERAKRSARELELTLLCANDADARRGLLEARRAVTKDATERALVVTRLGEVALRGRAMQRGEDLLRQVSDDPSAWRARLRIAELDADRGLVELARAHLEALAKIAPARRVREARALVAQRAGLREYTVQLYTALVAELPGDVSLARQLASIERAQGTRVAMERALTHLQQSHDVRDDESLAIERAELEEGLGHRDRAVMLLRAQLERTLDDARIEERLGRLLLAGSVGERTDGITHLQAALRLRPQNPELRALLGEIGHPDGSADLWRRWRVDPVALREQAKAEPLGREDPARVLYDGATIHVHDNGLEETLVERVIEIRDRRGAEQQGQEDIRYSPDSQTVEIRVARIYKTNGEIVDAASIDERDLSEPWSGVFYDMHAQIVSWPALEPGDVVHIAYTVSDHGRRNELGDSFCDLHMLQEEQVRLSSSYRLIAPKRRTIHFNTPQLGGAALPITTAEEGEERRYEVVARRVPKIVPEAMQPGQTELGAYVHASTFADWSDVARFYRTLLATQLDADAAIRNAAKDAVRGKKTVEEKVAAIYDLVVGSTRYVGLEFGVHGYQPYRVSQIFSRRFGDCKDKASLLVVMLREVGIDATLILLRTRREGALDPVPASLAVFDHAIAYVPALGRYLDGTAEFSGARELPADDQGVAVLHVNEGALKQTPIDGPTGSQADQRLVVKLAKDGSATADDRRRLAGEAAASWRQEYQAVGERKERLEKAWAQRSPGAEVRAVDLPHLDDREQAVEMVAQLTLPRAARVEGGTLAMPVLLREPSMLGSYARLSSRKHALELPAEFSDTERMRVELPSGMRARPVEPVQVDSPFGSFSLRAVVDARGVTIDAKTVFLKRRVTPQEYPAFRIFLAAIDRAVAGELRVEAAR